MNQVRLGVNIDHVATLRQARSTDYPDPIAAAFAAIEGGADGITLHLREDRRHIQDRDVIVLKERLTVPMNLEMAVSEAMLRFAETIQPANCCFVPEKREELTTEGGLDVLRHSAIIQKACERLRRAGIQVSLFIDPEESLMEAAQQCGAPVIEIHTGYYANATRDSERQQQLQRIQHAADYAKARGFIVNAGQGLTIDNVSPIAAMPVIDEFNIGHSLVARALFIGLTAAVREMKALLIQARYPRQATG